MIELSSWIFFGVLEFAIVLSVTALFFIVRSYLLSRRIELLKRRIEDLSTPVQEAEGSGFEQHLRDEILCNQALLGQPESDELFTMRKQFLEIELEARALEGNPAAFEENLLEGLRKLRAQWLPPAPAMEAPDIEISGGDEVRETVDTSSDEFDRLKQVINNQQDALSVLREELEHRESPIDDAGSVPISRELSLDDDETPDIDTRVQELEALIEFKDAAIDELEKQLNSLEASLAGEQKVG